jgi:HEAT repeat protein
MGNMLSEFEENISALKSSDLETVENAIKELGHSKDKRAIPILMDMLSREEDTNIKNVLALSLGDLRANEAVPLLMKLIKAPENKNKRGSFVYALQDLDCKEYFLDIVDLICTGSYEVCDHALTIFESLVDDTSFSDKLIAKEMLEKQEQIELALPPSKRPEYDRIHFIKDALKLLED